MWVSTLLDVCRLMGNYPISYINIAYKAARKQDEQPDNNVPVADEVNGAS